MGKGSAVEDPGGIERLFSSLKERFPQYNVEIISSEPDGPWIATFDNFVTDEETRTVRQLTHSKLKRSTDQGQIDAKTGIMNQLTQNSRTSTNAWCQDECARNPVVSKLLNRVAEVVQVQPDNFENMQVLRYDVGQEYQTHHDSSQRDFESLEGPRLYTMFLYFEEVAEGGGTRFPNLNLTVEPKKGKALLWPSIKNSNPREIDGRTHHAALPVIRGTKLGANVWVHQRNYRIPQHWGCTGSFE